MTKTSMIIISAIFILVLLAFKFLFVVPFVSAFGVIGAVLFIALCYGVAVWIDRKEKRS